MTNIRFSYSALVLLAWGQLHADAVRRLLAQASEAADLGCEAEAQVFLAEAKKEYDKLKLVGRTH